MLKILILAMLIVQTPLVSAQQFQDVTWTDNRKLNWEQFIGVWRITDEWGEKDWIYIYKQGNMFAMRCNRVKTGNSSWCEVKDTELIFGVKSGFLSIALRVEVNRKELGLRLTGKKTAIDGSNWKGTFKLDSLTYEEAAALGWKP